MGLRRWSIRMRIFLLVAIPILSLIGLYAFAATITASDAINLSRSRTLHDTIGTPTGNVEAQVDTERTLAVIYLAAPAAPNLAVLHAQEQKTEHAQAAFNAAVRSTATTSSAYPPEKQAITAMLRDLSSLSALRSQVAALSITRPRVISAYGAVIADADAVLNQAILQESNVPLATQALALVRTGKSEEILLNEAALLTGDILARSFSVADRQEFSQLAGARRAFYSQTLPDLEPQYRAIFARDVSPQAMAALVALENKVIADPHPGRVPPVPITSWNAAVQGVSAGLSKAGTQVGEQLVMRAQPVADSAFIRLFLVGGLGLLAVILSIFASIWIGRGLVRQLADLRRSALELASKRLPGVVAKLRAGHDVDVSAEAPPLESGSDEIGQVTAAFNAVQETAVQAAVDEAKLRNGVSDVFRNLARRSQSLLHRQLALLDTMERRASEPGELEDLFRIDHLTTRMRRHSESLIILSGESPGRGWRHPVRLVDVLRAAVAEVEDYTRIRVTTGTPAALIGPAVADVIHLIAELAENATIFSPPNAPVRIHGDVVGRGFAVEIEDRGLGIAEEKLAQINHDLEHPPQFDLSGSEQLGLFVAGQLARRHDIKITLQSSPYGGITAVVLIPKDLIVDDTEAAAIAAGERAIRLTGRHGSLNRGAIAEPAALAQLSAATSAADQQPGPAAELPSGPSAAAAPAGPAADAPAVSLPRADSVFTPQRPRTATAVPGGSFRFGAERPHDYGAASDAADPLVTTTELTEMGLPVRVRQASLAPQLRDRAALAADPDEPTAGAPTPEAARSTMTALQRGWERGRYITGAPVPSFDPAPDSEPSEDGDERAGE
jgi:signal transduction histidine kinase